MITYFYNYKYVNIYIYILFYMYILIKVMMYNSLFIMLQRTDECINKNMKRGLIIKNI